MLAGNKPILESFFSNEKKFMKSKGNLISSMNDFRKNEILNSFKNFQNVFFPGISDIFASVQEWNDPLNYYRFKII